MNNNLLLGDNMNIITNLKKMINNQILKLEDLWSYNVLVVKMDGVKIYARKETPSDQKFSDHIYENCVYTDKPSQEWACLMPNCHRVYFLIEKNGKLALGMSQILNFKNINEYQSFRDFIFYEMNLTAMKNNKSWKQCIESSLTN